jgi:hypothetical protein
MQRGEMAIQSVLLVISIMASVVAQAVTLPTARGPLWPLKRDLWEGKVTKPEGLRIKRLLLKPREPDAPVPDPDS